MVINRKKVAINYFLNYLFQVFWD